MKPPETYHAWKHGDSVGIYKLSSEVSGHSTPFPNLEKEI